MKSSYSLVQVGDCFSDWFSTTAGTEFSGCNVTFPNYYSEFNSTFDFDSFWKKINALSIPKEQYSTYPKMSHYVTKDGVQHLEIACTGFEEDEIKIVFKEDTIIIRASNDVEKVKKEKELDKKYFIKEIATRDFEESFKISDQYDYSKIKAVYKNGLLKIDIPLKEEVAKMREEKEIKIGK